jgi:tetratricopeptide (TPR) repeat protein/CHAT domain-containing protein
MLVGLLCGATCHATRGVPELSFDDDIRAIRDLIDGVRYDEAETLARETLGKVEAVHGAESAEAAAVLDLLVEAIWRGALGRAVADSRDLAERAVQIKEAVFGAEHPETATSLSNLASLLASLGDDSEPPELFERVLRIREASFGPEHPAVADTWYDYARFVFLLWATEAVRPPLERAIEIHERSAPEDHAQMAGMLNLLAYVLAAVGDVYQAGATVDRAFAEQTKAGLDDHPDMAPGLHARGILHGRGGDLERARELHVQAAELRRKWLGPNHPLLAMSLMDLGTNLGNLRRYEEALAPVREGTRIREVAFGPYHYRVAVAIKETGRLLGKLERKDEAVAEYERALDVLEAGVGPEHHQVASVLTDLAGLYLDEDPERGLSYYERALRIWEAAYGSEHADVAMAYSNLGAALDRLGRNEEAEQHYEQAVNIAEKVLGPDHKSVAFYLRNLARVREELGKFDQAESEYKRILEIRSKLSGPGSPDVATVHFDLGWMRYRQGDFTEAKTHFERALEIREETLGPEDPTTIEPLTWIGVMLSHLGDYAGARECKERSLRLAERIYGPDSQEYAHSLLHLGGFLGMWGQAEDGLPMMRRAAEIVERALGPGRTAAYYLQNLAFGLNAVGKYEEALQVLQRAADFYELGVATDPHSPALFYINRAIALGGIDRPTEARRDFEQALDSVRQAAGPSNPLTALVLTEQAHFEWKQSRSDTALSRASEASEILDRNVHDALRSLPEQQALRWVGSRFFGRPEEILYEGMLRSGENRQEWIGQCWQATLRRRGLVLEELAARNREVLAADSEQAGEALEELRAARRKLSALWVRGSEVGSPDDSRSDLGGQSHPIALEQALREKEQAESRLASVSALFRASREPRELRLSDVAASLAKGHAVVEYVRIPLAGGLNRSRLGSKEGELHDVALILRGGDDQPTFADLGLAKDVDERVAAWRQALHRAFVALAADEGSIPSLVEVAETGRRLRRAVWDPVRKQIQQAKTVFLIPDGSLHRVSFAALPAEDGGYLLEVGPALHVLSTSRDLVRLQRPDEETLTGRGVLALGGPDYDAGRAVRLASLEQADGSTAFRGGLTECPLLQETRWSPLPESLREAEDVVALFRSHEKTATVLSNAAASEESFKREAPGKRILHVATHGFFLQGGCASAIAVGRGIGGLADHQWTPTTTERIEIDRPADSKAGSDANASARIPLIGENPLLLSGLALAGANRIADTADGDSGLTGEDGILTAEEIAALDLRGVEIASLSACDTGLGTVEIGEGVFGLRRALEIAGVRTVLMSLWPVPDREAREWMTRFYKAELEGKSVLDASRGASLSVLEQLREEGRPTHPYLWAGFVTAGDWR